MMATREHLLQWPFVQFPSVRRIVHGPGLVYPASAVFRPAAAFSLLPTKYFFVNRTRSASTRLQKKIQRNYVFWKQTSSLQFLV
jgi:hypothetical protein